MQATYPAVGTDENFAREVEKHEAQMKLAALEDQIEYSRNETHRYELRTRLTIALLRLLYLGEDQLHELIKKFFVRPML